MWKPITSGERLVAIFEKSDLDLKRRYDLTLAKTPYDIARDVAAFASSAGGTIVVGADEQAGRISRLPGVDDPPMLVRELGKAVQTFCSPWPLYQEAVVNLSSVDCARILSNEGDPPPTAVDLVLVNVPPDLRGPIGVRPKNDKGNAIKDSYGFPVRVGEQTNWLGPTEIPMWMNSHERRIAIQLRQIVPREIVRVFATDDEITVNLEGVDEAELSAIFSRVGADTAHVPLACVVAVWREPRDNVWSMKIDGTIFRNQQYAFKPRRE